MYKFEYNNYDFILKNVKNYPLFLEYASKGLKNNYEIVMAAVNKDCMHLKN